MVKDWRKILFEIYTPDIGSVWAVPNKMWDNEFASNKDQNSFHPALLERNSSCHTISYIVPGTTKCYRKGSCVFKIKLNPNKVDYPFSYFLIDLSMAISKTDLMKLKQCWDGIKNLNDEQLKSFKLQIKFCKGINV